MKRMMVLMTVVAMMVAIMAMSVAPAFAQQGPPAQSPGCDRFIEAGAADQISGNPSVEAFIKQQQRLGGIGPCFAPHPDGRD